MLNLLSLQAELLELEMRFRETCEEDDLSGVGNDHLHSIYFNALRSSQGSDNDAQLDLLYQIREKLGVYSAWI
jgi:hypothetical protein